MYFSILLYAIEFLFKKKCLSVCLSDSIRVGAKWIDLQMDRACETEFIYD